MKLHRTLVMAVAIATLVPIGELCAQSHQVTVLVKLLSDPFGVEIERGAQEEAKKLGLKCAVLGPNAAEEAEQIRMMRDLITKGADGIAVSCLNGEAMTGPINDAHAKGIPVVTLDSDSAKSERQCYIGTNNYQAGVEAGKAFRQLMPKNGTYAVLTANLAAINLNERIRGFKDGLGDGYQEIQGSPLTCDDNVPKAIQLVQDTLTRNPKLDGLFFAGGWPMYAREAYIRALGSHAPDIKTKKFVIVSFDNLVSQLELLKDGYANVLVGQRPAAMGSKAVEVLNELVDHHPIQDSYDTGVDIVTPENVAEFLKK